MTQYRTPTKRIKSALNFDGETSLTKQAFKDEADVNKIVGRYRKTGVLPPALGTPQYGDFADVPSYMDALNLVARAQETFYALPAETRLECENNPAIFLDRVQNDPEWAKKHKLTAEAATPSPASPNPSQGNGGASNPPEPKKNGAEKSDSPPTT